MAVYSVQTTYLSHHATHTQKKRVLYLVKLHERLTKHWRAATHFENLATHPSAFGSEFPAQEMRVLIGLPAVAMGKRSK